MTIKTEKMIEFVNLTPHTVTVVLPDGVRNEISASGVVARVTTTREQIGTIAGIPVFTTRYGEVSDLPEPSEGAIYVVSALVRTHPAVVHRQDVCSPGGLIRDTEGKIVGCDGLDFNTAPV